MLDSKKPSNFFGTCFSRPALEIGTGFRPLLAYWRPCQCHNGLLGAQGSNNDRGRIAIAAARKHGFRCRDRWRRPAGLAAAIRLKQLSPELSVVVVEKGAEIGAHILSGAVIDPCALDALLPDWRQDKDRPLKTEVTADRFYVLGAKSAVRLPNFIMPRLMNNHGNFIGSLGNVVRYLGKRRRPWASISFRASPAPRSSMAKRARFWALRRETWASPATATQERFYAGNGASRQIHFDRRGCARFARQAADRQFWPRQQS